MGAFINNLMNRMKKFRLEWIMISWEQYDSNKNVLKKCWYSDDRLVIYLLYVLIVQKRLIVVR
jgi:hypothetical protein